MKQLIKKVAVSSFVLGTAFQTTNMQVNAINGLDMTSIMTNANYTTQNGVANLSLGDASITIRPNGEQTLVGKKFQVYQLFNVENAAGLESVNYTFNPKYAPALKKIVGKKLGKQESLVTEYEVIDYMQSLSEKNHQENVLEGSYSAYRNFAEELRDTMVGMSIEGDIVEVTTCLDDGSFEIAGLAYGYYFIDEISYTSGEHAASSLCILNTANPDAEAYIKSDFPSVIKKIQEDDHREQIGNEGWNDLADYEIGQTVPYQFISHIPNMNGYDTYYYAWHDQMDQALTFNPNSIQIVISDDTKSYRLSSSEFNTINSASANETFKVEVSDIKAIIDREFDQMNDDGENIYGQQVVLTYNATLNDLAALDTGRQGFENSVMLEFSNNPDHDGKGETGKTPWDTVVCFTYKLQGLKINSDQKNLEGAKFRLYEDEACTKEILVKKADDGYHVMNQDSTPSDAVEMVSDKDGLFTIIGLDSGVYWLKETDSPAGYRELLDPIRLTITATFTNDRNQYVKGDGATDKALVQLEANAYVKEFLDGLFGEKTTDLQTDVNQGLINLTVINTIGHQLPITGGATMMICLSTGMVLLSLGFVWWMKNKKREK